MGKVCRRRGGVATDSTKCRTECARVYVYICAPSLLLSPTRARENELPSASTRYAIFKSVFLALGSATNANARASRATRRAIEELTFKACLESVSFELHRLRAAKRQRTLQSLLCTFTHLQNDLNIFQ